QTLWVNDAEVPTGFRDDPGGVLRATILPQPGRNEVRVRLRNAWGVEATSRPLILWYKRPPRVTAVRSVRVTGRPLVNLEADVSSPESLGLPSGRLQRERPTLSGPGEVEEVPAEATIGRVGPERFVLTVRNVPLKAGKNRFQVWASNLDG